MRNFVLWGERERKQVPPGPVHYLTHSPTQHEEFCIRNAKYQSAITACAGLFIYLALTFTSDTGLLPASFFFTPVLFGRHKCTPTQWKEFHISRGNQSHLSSLRDSVALLPLHGLNNNESGEHADRLPPCIQHDSMRQQPFVLVKQHRKSMQTGMVRTVPGTPWKMFCK